MKQHQEDIKARARRASERIDESLRNGAPYPVIDGGGGLDPDRRVAHLRWSPARKFADALLYRIFGRGLRDPMIDRQRD